MDISRRNVLQLGGLGALAVGGMTLPLSNAVVAKSASALVESLLPTPYGRQFAIPPVLNPSETGEDEFGRYATYIINQQPATAQVLPSGQLMHGFGYNGSIPGPTLHVERGVRVVAKVRNRLPETHPVFGHRFATSTHLHGNPSLPEYDGYASDVTLPGNSKVYQWPTVDTSSRTLWYHDHGVHHTAENVYSGLFGMYQVHDATERALLPTQSPYDVPLIVGDCMFNADGSLGYDDREHSGLWGDVILVNGVPWPVMRVQRRVYRFRMLNASISRSYRPTLFPGGSMHMVGTDAGMMPRSREVTTWRHGTAERYEFLIDFRNYAAGQRVELRNLSNDNNRDFDNTDKIMAFDVTDDPVDVGDPTWNVIPDTLHTHEVMTYTRDMAARTRTLEFKKTGLNDLWSVNGRTWDDIIASGFREVVANPDLGEIEIWRLHNTGGGWFHPVHTHLVDQQILSRNGGAPFDYELGPKDVIYTGENEVVEIIMKFGPHRGRYMIHCHNLPHEDHDMMVQFSVGLGPEDVDPHDPIGSDPASRDDDDDHGRSPDPWPPKEPRRPRQDNSGPGSGSSGPGSGSSGGGSDDEDEPPRRRRRRPKKGKKGKGKDPKGKKGKKGKKGPKGRGLKGGKGKPRPPRGRRRSA